MTRMSQEAWADLARRMERLSVDPVFTEFLLATKRIYARRKEDVQIRRAGDATPTKAFVRRCLRYRAQLPGDIVPWGGPEFCAQLVAEFDAWLLDNSKHEERRK